MQSKSKISQKSQRKQGKLQKKARFLKRLPKERKKKKEKVGTRIRLGLKPWGELKILKLNDLREIIDLENRL